MRFEYKTAVTVTELEMKWDLYWYMVEEGEVSKNRLEMVNGFITTAARRALENKDMTIFETECEKWWQYGATDSEPRWQFERLWNEAYGEVI